MVLLIILYFLGHNFWPLFRQRERERQLCGSVWDMEHICLENRRKNGQIMEGDICELFYVLFILWGILYCLISY
jgi:hypothetical protein